MKKVALLLLAAVLAFGFSGQAMAADGNVSNGILADMGLSSMQSMTDTQGDEIRGKGFASVWGFSTAHVRGASTRNSYKAFGRHGALGDTGSSAGFGWHSVSAGGYANAFSF